MLIPLLQLGKTPLLTWGRGADFVRRPCSHAVALDQMIATNYGLSAFIHWAIGWEVTRQFGGHLVECSYQIYGSASTSSSKNTGKAYCGYCCSKYIHIMHARVGTYSQ